MPLLKSDMHTIDEIYALPQGQRAELIDGQIYGMAPPNRIHQRLCLFLSRKIADYIDSKNDPCEVDIAPFAVFLNEDGKNYVEPDISVICDRKKLGERGCNSAPDWIIEIASESTKRMDYGVKLFKYRTAGVREYWIVNPLTKTVNVYDFAHDQMTDQYTFDEEIPVCIFEDLKIKISDLRD